MKPFFLMPVVDNEVLNEILKLNPQKACGPDKITTKLIKTCADELQNPLTHLFNAAIASAQFPDPWKIAKVLSLYKKKSKYFPENYRPISLLNCFGKILEKLVYKQMIKFIEKHKILYLYQNGFRKNHSTCRALIYIVEKIKTRLIKMTMSWAYFSISQRHLTQSITEFFVTNWNIMASEGTA